MEAVLGNEAGGMTTRPITHARKGYAVLFVQRKSSLDDPLVIGLAVKTAERRYPDVPVVVAFVNEVCEKVEVRGE